MKVLLTIPHVFAPQAGSLYSSQTESKRNLKQAALERCTVENISRHKRNHWIHASLGKAKPVVTREVQCMSGIDLTIQIYTVDNQNLTAHIPTIDGLEVIYLDIDDFTQIPSVASRRALEQACSFDLVGYMEDDILIEDAEFFHKILWLIQRTSEDYAFLPHRCELIPGRGDVILSGDPDGGRPDLFWDTGERIGVEWPTGIRQFYRATNPHSGCYFLSRNQANKVMNYWNSINWTASYQLGGPLEQACSGILLPLLKLMKPIPSDYRFLMVRHQDELWRRHPFEELKEEQVNQ